MKRGVKIAIAILLLVIVAAVLISPAVDLAPTALRAAIWSSALFASIVAIALAFAGFRPASSAERVLMRPFRLLLKLIPVTDLACVRLC
ncbi:MAG TPA: hypothetical protein VMT38_10690 [Terracidiphilus sp.]|nr:hypothetical protein [Terracidiphilus sp.]